jgi:chromosome segregation ATPase
MPETDDFNKATSSTDVPPPAVAPNAIAPAAVVAELESLIGQARGAANEAENLRQAALKSATDAELARTKAAEHLRELEAKRTSADDEAATIKSLAKTIESRGVSIDDQAKVANKNSDRIVADGQRTGQLKLQIEQDAQQSSQAASSLQLLLADLTAKSEKITPLNDEMTKLWEKVTQLIATCEQASTDTIKFRATAQANTDATATNNRHVEDGKAYIEAERARAERAASAASNKLAETEEAATAAQASLNTANAARDNASTALAEAKGVATAIGELKTAAEADRQVTENLAKTAASMEERVKNYETELARLTSSYNTMHAKIESLLPGAASAGLAAAFHQQKRSYSIPRRLWNATFLAALAGLIAIGAVEIYHQWSNPNPEIQQVARSLLTRLPMAAAFVWLALHASNKARTASQIQEDYAYKEVVSRAFEGYKKEFGALDQQTRPDSALGTLCGSVVALIAASPSRVYDKHAHDPTPISSVTELAKELGTVLKEAKTPPKLLS